MSQAVTEAKSWEGLRGRRVQLQRKGLSDAEHGVVSEVSDTHVAFIFDDGGVIYIPLGDITEMTEERERPGVQAGVQTTTPPPGDAQIVEKAVDEEGHVTAEKRLRSESETTDPRQQPVKEDVNVEPVRDPDEKKRRLDSASEAERPFKEWPDTPAHPHQPVEPDKPEHRQQKAVGETIRRPADAQVGEPVQKQMAREEREAKQDQRTSHEKATEKRKGQ
jgi:hypothetical protein